jgi:predicted O-methyltransferase YrrM
MSDLIDRILQHHTDLGGHWAGSLGASPLLRIESYLQTYFAGREIRSVETGCGASTIVFAEYAAHHTAYCYDDRSASGSSVNFAQSFSGFCAERVKWVYGPTQQTIFNEPLEGPVDIVLIDGPHGYPFPELEYFAFYKWLRPGGILIVDDIHIPTINNLYRFLLQDDSFRFDGLARTTAYFQRTDRPAFNMEGDDWWLQRYNVQSFPAVRLDSPSAAVRLPISVVFDQTLATGAPFLTRGFSLLDCPPTSEGAVSSVEMQLENAPEHVKVELDIDPVCVEEREDCGVTVLANTQQVGSWDFASPGRRTVELEASSSNEGTLTLEFRNHGLKMGRSLKAWAKSADPDARLPNFRLHSITLSDSSVEAQPTHLRRADGSIVTFDYNGQTFSFFVDQAHDPVQAFHTACRFYELDQLDELKRRVATGACILDVGAHAGNHAVYFEKVMQAKRIVVIEPNPRAQFLIRTNCALNNLRTIDLAYLDNTLINNTTGDDLFASEHFDLIKLDVDGIELDVLQGLAATIERCRPLLFINVKEAKKEEFIARLKDWHFDVLSEVQAKPDTTNLLVGATANAESAENRTGASAPGNTTPPGEQLTPSAEHGARVVSECWAVAESQGPAAARSLLWRMVAGDPTLLRNRSVLGALRRLHGLGPTTIR